MSNRLPANGIAPMPTSIPRFTTILAIVTSGTPRKNAASTMMQLASPARKSPMPGMNPMIPSSPKRIEVPGTRNHVSSTRESRSRFSSRNAPPAPNRGFRAPESTMPGRNTSPYPIFVAIALPCPLRCLSELDATIDSGTAAIVQWQNAALWQRMSWVRTPLAAPKFPLHRGILPQPLRSIFAHSLLCASFVRSTTLPRASKAPEPVSAPPSAPNLFVGTSGWAYPTWKPAFYPAKLPARSFLNYYGSQLTAVEVNYTFRALPTNTQLENWQAAVPTCFRFSFKAPQRITHFARLRDCETLVQNFLGSLSPMRAGNLGPLLFQLPPNLHANRELLARFLDLPAFHHTHVQLTFEFRHNSWFTDEIFSLMREHNTALCVAESDDLSTPDIQTASVR